MSNLIWAFSNIPEGDTLEIALLLIKDYEDRYHAIPYPDSIEAIKAKMEDNGLKNKDFVDWVGSKSYLSALLNRKSHSLCDWQKLFMRNWESRQRCC